MSTPTVEDVINAAASVATDVAEGRLLPADLECQAVQELSALMLTEPDHGSELWNLQTEVARRVLARGALPSDEIAEWAAVQQRRENPYPDTDSTAVLPLDALELHEAGNVLPDEDSTVSVTHSPENEPAADVPSDEPEREHADNGLMVTLADGRRVSRRLIAARGFGLPSDGGLTVL